jgi:hypothetical protein
MSGSNAAMNVKVRGGNRSSGWKQLLN